MTPTPDISVVIPVYKSARILPELHQRLSQVLDPAWPNHQIVFVNDCSPDDSWNVLAGISAADHTVTALRLRRNFGYDCAVMAGLRAATGRIVVLMDDDLQHAPEDIPPLVAALAVGRLDVVYANFPVKRQSLLKNMGSWLNDLLARAIIGKPSEIYLSPFKAMDGGLIQEIVTYDGPFPYVDGLIFQRTSAIGQIAVAHHPRASGSGGHGIRRSLKIMFNFCTTFSVLPLRLAILAGVCVSAVSAILGIILVLIKIRYGVDVEGWTSIIVAILLMGGIQLVVTGVVGEYIGRAYMNISRSPQYVTAESIGSAAQPRKDVSARTKDAQ